MGTCVSCGGGCRWRQLASTKPVWTHKPEVKLPAIAVRQIVNREVHAVLETALITARRRNARKLNRGYAVDVYAFSELLELPVSRSIVEHCVDRPEIAQGDLAVDDFRSQHGENWAALLPVAFRSCQEVDQERRIQGADFLPDQLEEIAFLGRGRRVRAFQIVPAFSRAACRSSPIAIQGVCMPQSSQKMQQTFSCGIAKSERASRSFICGAARSSALR